MFYRQLGDTDLDRDTDVQDLGRFGGTFRLKTADDGFLAEYDFDGDGDVDVQDLGRFGTHFRNSLDFS